MLACTLLQPEKFIRLGSSFALSGWHHGVLQQIEIKNVYGWARVENGLVLLPTAFKPLGSMLAS